MPRHLVSLASLLAGTAVLLVGHGLQLTLLPLRADAMAWTPQAIGLTGSAYFGGFIVGCFSIPRVIAAVGHVRAFMVLTAAATAALLGIALLDNFAAWLVLRFATGCAISGLYLVIESWLNEQSSNELRGTVLSVYTVIVLAAMVVGQLLLNLAPPTSFEAVAIGTLFLCLAAVPVGLSRSAAPTTAPDARFSLRRVYDTSHAAVGGAFAAGCATGAFFTLAPVLGRGAGLDVATVANMMIAGIVGGALLQLPLGRLSDTIDRRHVMLIAMLVGAGVCLVVSALDLARPIVMLTAMFLLGGATLPIYSICLAHANDNSAGNFLEIGTGILIVNALGAMIGPSVAAAVMNLFASEAYFWCNAVFLAAGGAWIIAAIRGRPARRPYFMPFKSAPDTTQGAVELDPRSDDVAEGGL